LLSILLYDFDFSNNRGIREKILQKNFQKYSEYIGASTKKILDDGNLNYKICWSQLQKTCICVHDIVCAITIIAVLSATHNIHKFRLKFEYLENHNLINQNCSVTYCFCGISKTLGHNRIGSQTNISLIVFFLCTTGESDSDSDEEETEGENKDENGPTKSKKIQPLDDEWYPVQEFAVNKGILKEVEELEEKVFTASLQVKVSHSPINDFVFQNIPVRVQTWVKGGEMWSVP